MSRCEYSTSSNGLRLYCEYREDIALYTFLSQDLLVRTNNAPDSLTKLLYDLINHFVRYLIA